MNESVRIELKNIHESIKNWPSDEIRIEQDVKSMIALTDEYFQKVEQDLITVLGAIQKLPVVQQKEFASDVNNLKILVEDKFKCAEQELKEVQARMDSGRIHAKAIRAYAQV
jgi:hypothetical protein